MSEFKLPDPVTVNQWGTQLRYTAILLGGVGIGSEWMVKISGLSDEELNKYISAVITIGSITLWLGPAVWGWVNNKFLTRDIKEVMVASSVASAQSGRAVVTEVIQTEKGMLNIAIPMGVPHDEIMKSAIVPGGAETTTKDLNVEELIRHRS